MANPKVRPYLHFYPEDTRGRLLAEARQAARWVHEVADEVLTPMIRLPSGQDYYIHEPAMLDSGEVCLPVRWFTRMVGGKFEWYAKAWRMEAIASEHAVGWQVIACNNYEVAAADLLKNFPTLKADADYHGLPNPSSILGERHRSQLRLWLLIAHLICNSCLRRPD